MKPALQAHAKTHPAENRTPPIFINFNILKPSIALPSASRTVKLRGIMTQTKLTEVNINKPIVINGSG